RKLWSGDLTIIAKFPCKSAISEIVVTIQSLRIVMFVAFPKATTMNRIGMLRAWLPRTRALSVVIASDGKALRRLISSAPQDRLLVVDYSASWCGPCRSFAPAYEAMSKKFKEAADFIKVDIDDAQEYVAKASITSVPTFQLIKGSNVVDVIVGADQARLEKAIRTHQ
ncbi:hypothetical protein BVRB_035610, partial [Beta vulgaris subsp. vulgaris]